MESRKEGNMNLEKVTVQDCIDMCDMKNQAVVLNDRKVIGFTEKEIPTQTANPSGD